jgi:hypothetical protein
LNQLLDSHEIQQGGHAIEGDLTVMLFNPLASIDSREIQQGGHAIEGDLTVMLFNPLASNIPKWWTIKLLRWMQNLHQST